MRRPRAGRLAALAAVAATALLPATASAAPVSALVGVSSPGDAQALAADLRADGMDVSAIPRIGVLRVSGDALSAVRDRVRHDERADWVEAPQEMHLLVAGGSLSDVQVAAIPRGLAVPLLDLVTGRETDWFTDAIHAPEGLALAPAALPVRVAVVDSGVDVDHPDLRGRVTSGSNVIPGSAGVTDRVGHGTFVAGLISGIDGNGIGGRGVAGATVVVPVKVTDSMSITSDNVAAGIVKAASTDGVGVINLSFGGEKLSPAIQKALEFAAARDVLVVAAAGNTKSTGNAPLHPAVDIGGYQGGWSSGLSVAATGPNGRRATSSTTNAGVSVAAPAAGSGCGDGVLSTIPSNLTLLWDPSPAAAPACVPSVFGLIGTLTGRYAYGDGTSFAAPLVAGAAALVRDTNPALTAEQTADVIRRTAHQTLGTGWNEETGAGVIDVKNAVLLARTYDTREPEASVAAAPGPAAVTVTLVARDVTGPSDSLAGVASYRLEASSDGSSWSEVVPAQATPIAFTDTAAAGPRRWYRGTACDVNHNCTTTAPSGPYTARAATTPAPKAKAKGAAVTLRASALTLRRTAACRTCVTAIFTAVASDHSVVKWRVAPQTGAGVRTVLAKGAVRAGGRVMVKIRLSRIPLCRTTLKLKVTLTSPTVAGSRTRAIVISGKCRRH